MKPQDSKKIAWITISLGFIGLVKDLIPFTSGPSRLWLVIFSDLFSLVQLEFPGSRSISSSIYFGENVIFINYVNLVFYCLLFIGGILFLQSRKRETRLIRFCFSVVFLYQVIFLLSSLLHVVLNTGELKKASVKWWLIWLSFLLLRLFYLYLSYWIISTISKTKQLKLTVVKSDEGESTYLAEASKSQRFWHWLVDAIIFLLIILFLVETTRINFWRSLGSSSTTGYVTLLLLIVVRMLYYIIYETIFGVTPAKFLTETRVTDDEGRKNKFSTILVRTLSRIIPFEPFSFFWDAKWHDSLSDTFVLKEERTGYKGILYLWLIPFFLLIGFGAYFGYDSYKKNEYYKKDKKEFSQKMDALKTQYQHISTKHIIVIRANDSYSNEYLKVEEIKASSIVVAKIKTSEAGYSGKQDFRKVYLKQTDSLQRIEINKQDIDKALTVNFEEYRKNNDHHYSNLLKSGTWYEIQDIVRLNGPILENNVSAWTEQNSAEDNVTVHFDFSNSAEVGRLIEIKQVEGDIKWGENLPLVLRATALYNNSFRITGFDMKRDINYKFILVLEDDAFNKYKYLVEGENSSFKLKEIYD